MTKKIKVFAIILLCGLCLFMTGRCINDKHESDLAALDFRYRPSSIGVGDKVVFEYAVKNFGPDSVLAGSYEVELLIDGEEVAFDRDTPQLPSGGGVEYGMKNGLYHWSPKRSGRFKYTLRITTDRFIIDPDSENNEVTGELLVD